MKPRLDHFYRWSSSADIPEEDVIDMDGVTVVDF